MPDETCYYFGCWDGPGHYLHNKDGRTIYAGAAGPLRIPCTNALDGTFAPPFCLENEHRYALTVVHNWTILAMWDRSVDNRPGSNAAFLVPGVRTFDQMVDIVVAQYPQMAARIKCLQAIAARRMALTRVPGYAGDPP